MINQSFFSKFRDSLIGLLQPLDLSLQLKVGCTTCRHPTERQNMTQCCIDASSPLQFSPLNVISHPNICAPPLLSLIFNLNQTELVSVIAFGLITHSSTLSWNLTLSSNCWSIWDEASIWDVNSTVCCFKVLVNNEWFFRHFHEDLLAGFEAPTQARFGCRKAKPIYYSSTIS